MKHWHWISLAFLAVVLTVVALAVPRLVGGPEKATAQEPSGITASLDMDTTDGPCTDIDSSTSHAPGDDYYVAICVEGLYGLTGTGIGILSFDVIYSDILNTAPEVANSGTALDDNPDANVGSTTWGTSLGTGWDCSNGGLAYPTGDRDAVDGAGHGDAFISCSSTTGPWTLGDTETSGVIARIRFQTTGFEGIDSMTISNGLLGYGDTTEMGSCNPAVTWEMDCVGGTDDKSGTPWASPTPTDTPTITPTPWCGGPGQPECPTATNTPRPWTKTPSPTPTDTPGAPEEGGEGEPPPPPPPPPPAAEQMPQVVPPGTGSGPVEGMPWLTGLLWVMAGAGAASVALGGLCLRSGRGRVR